MSEILATNWFHFLVRSQYANGATDMNSWNQIGNIQQVSDGINNDLQNRGGCNHGGSTAVTGTFYTYVARIQQPSIAIPSRGKLIGIEVRAHMNDTSSTNDTYDYLARLTWDGNLIGQNKATGSLSPSGAFVANSWPYVYGGQNDLWGVDFELDDLVQNPSLFGIDFQGRHVDNSTGSTTTVYLYEIQARLFIDLTAMLAAM